MLGRCVRRVSREPFKVGVECLGGASFSSGLGIGSSSGSLSGSGSRIGLGSGMGGGVGTGVGDGSGLGRMAIVFSFRSAPWQALRDPDRLDVLPDLK